MGDKRMISKKIFASGKFLEMPISARALYAYLVLYSDDDGIVEGNSILRLTGCSIDDLKILAVKGFITILDEYNVSYIHNWLSINSIRADRYIPSIHQDLLKKRFPEIKLIEKKERSDRRNNTLVKEANDTKIIVGQSPKIDNNLDTIKRDGTSKAKLSKANINNKLVAEFEKHNISSFLKLFLKKFRDPNLILRQLSNLDIELNNGISIDDIPAWLFVACKNDYPLKKKRAITKPINATTSNKENTNQLQLQLDELKKDIN